jgi:ribosomal protein S27AE
MLYTVSEISAAVGLPERTLRDWLEAGAPHERDQHARIWIHGKKFAGWIADIRKPVKGRKLKNDEAYCMRCNQAVQMIDVSIKAMQGKLILIRGTCPNCGCTINRGGRLPTYSPDQITAEEIQHAE